MVSFRNLLLSSAAILSVAAPVRAEVGVAAAVNTLSTLERGAAQRTVLVGSDVALQDRIITSADGLVQVLFVDGSTFTVGANSRVVIDEFVYDPATGGGSLVAEVTRGALRFVGGQLSKGDQPVRFKTPVGILGARGAIVDIDTEPGCLSPGQCPVLTATLSFGDELTFSDGDGAPERIFEPGNAFVIYRDGTGHRADIVPIAALDQGGLARRLAGDPRQSGGIGNAPTDADVVESGLPAINSSLAPRILPERFLRPVVTSSGAPEEEIPGLGGAIAQTQAAVSEAAQSDAIRDDVISQDPEFIRRPLNGTFGTPSSYTTPRGILIENPAPLGITLDAGGFFPQTETIEENGSIVAVSVGGLAFDLPANEGVTGISPVYSDTFGAYLRGRVTRGPGGFGIFALEEVSDPEAAPDPANRVGYILVGTPSPDTVFYPARGSRPLNLRTYDLGGDFLRYKQGISANAPLLNPLIATAFGNPFLENVVVQTPFYLVESPESDNLSRTMHTAFGIEGTGAGQRSMLSMDVGFLYKSTVEGDYALGIGGQRRGSYRLAADALPVFMRGGTGGMEIGDEQLLTSISGPNGQSFIYSSNINVGATLVSRGGERGFIDVPLSEPQVAPASPESYSSAAVPAFLGATQQLTSLDRPSILSRGFAAGLIETPDAPAVPFRSASAGDFLLSLDPDLSAVGALMRVVDTEDFSPVGYYRYALGIDLTGGANGSTRLRSAYIDTDRFAAVSTGPGNRQSGVTTLLSLDTGTVVTHAQQDPGTYLLSSGAAPQPQVFAAANVTPCACAYMQWGWWGTQTDFQSPELPGQSGKSIAHLGTWVTGDIPTNAELPTTGSGTFNGHAIGNVAALADTGVAQYVAVGDMSLTYDFAERVGTLDITNFDQRSFSGTMFGSGAANAPNGFAGELTGTGAAGFVDASGSASGAFVRGPAGPAQGVLGSFSMGGELYSATGTFMGER